MFSFTNPRLTFSSQMIEMMTDALTVLCMMIEFAAHVTDIFGAPNPNR